MDLKSGLAELRKNEKRKFSQSVDLIINLKGVDPKKENITTIITIPNLIKDKKICAFLNAKSDLVDTITKLDFPKYKDKKPLKMLIKNYDFFIASAPLMPSVATTFGKVLGPAGKMPSPQLGVVMQETPAAIKDLLKRVNESIKIKVKEPTVKLTVGKENMSDEQLIQNIQAVYGGLISVLPIKQDNVKNVMIKLTMSKPVKVEMRQ